MKFFKFLSSTWGVLLYIALDILVFFALSYNKLHWYIVNPANIPNWAVERGIGNLVSTFVFMMMAYSVPYLLYFPLLSRQMDKQTPNISLMAVMSFVFVFVKLVMAVAITFFSYIVPYL